MSILDEAVACAASTDINRGLRIVDTMKDKGLKVDNVKIHCGVTDRTLTRWRSGEKIDYANIDGLSSALSVTRAYLLFGFTGPVSIESARHEKSAKVDTDPSIMADIEPQKKIDNIFIREESDNFDDVELRFLAWFRSQEGLKQDEVVNRVLHPMCNTVGHRGLMHLSFNGISLNRYEAACLYVLRQLSPELAIRLVNECIKESDV